MKDLNYIYKTKPNYFFMFLMIIVTVVPAYFANLMWSTNEKIHGTDENMGHPIIIIIFLAILLAFSFVGFFLTVGFKIIYLMEDQIIINTPLFFYKRVIMFNEINGISEKEEQIDVNTRGFNPDMVSIGHNTTLQLTNGKKVGISSIQVWGYNELIKKIHARLRAGNGHNKH